MHASMRWGLPLVALGLVLAAAPGLAAQDRDRQAAERIDRDDERQRLRARFRQMDRNNDGVISRAEWQGSDRLFNILDRDHDGAIERHEVRQARDRRDEDDRDRRRGDDDDDDRDRNRGRDRDDDRDRDDGDRRDRDDDDDEDDDDGDDDDEGRENSWRRWDRNGDGVVTRSEWRGRSDAFTRLDRNGDGVLSGSELRDGR